MDMDKEVYNSNDMLGLIPVAEESESMSFHFGKLLTSESKDFFNCDTSIGLDYPVRSALQPICVHVDGSDESTNWVNPPCDDNVDLLDISSKRLPVDLGFNGLDKSSIYSSTNGNYNSTNLTPNNHVIINSLPPASEIPSHTETTDYYYDNSQTNDIYSMRADFSNHTPFVDSEKIYYNGNQSLYSNGYHSQHYDHPNHHVYHVHNLTPHQIYQNHHHHNHNQQPTTPLHHYLPQKKGQPPFQRHNTHRRRLNLYEKSTSSPIKQKQKHQPHQQQHHPQHQQPQHQQPQHQQPQHQPQSPIQGQKPAKPPKPAKAQKSPQIQKTQKTPKVQQRQKTQPIQSPTPPSKTQQQIVVKRKYQRLNVKSNEVKPELNQRSVLKKKLGRPRKYDYSPPKPIKFRSPRLRLRVQSEETNLEEVPDSGDSLRTRNRVQVQVKEKKIKEVLPCDWIKPDNLSFDRIIVSEYEKTSLPEFFAGKFDRTHFHPSQYLQIRNIFLDEWEKRKPNGVNFREMIRIHKGIGNVVSFSRVCKFLTAIGAINETSQDDDDDDDDDQNNEDNNNNGDDDVTKVSNTEEDDENSSSASKKSDKNQSKNQDEESEDIKDSCPKQPSSSTSSPPPSSSPYRETTNSSSSTTSSPPPTTTTTTTKTKTTSSEVKSSQPGVTSHPRRKGRKRKSYFLNEMTRLGIDPLSAGFPIPGFDREDKDDDNNEQTSTTNDDNDDQSENVQNSISPKA